MATKLTLEALMDLVDAQDSLFFATHNEEGRLAYRAVVDKILAEAGWTVDEYENELTSRILTEQGL